MFQVYEALSHITYAFALQLLNIKDSPKGSALNLIKGRKIGWEVRNENQRVPGGRSDTCRKDVCFIYLR